MPATDNPLLDFSALPRFGEIKPEHVAPAIDALLEENRTTIGRVTQAGMPVTWESVVQPMEDSGERLGRAWNQVNHLHAVADTPALREAYNQALPKLTGFYSELSQNLALYQQYKALRASGEFASYPAERQRALTNELRDFRLGGAELQQTDKARFKAIREELAQLSSQFEQNVLDATNAFALCVDSVDELAGIPADVLITARATAEIHGKPGWKLTLHAPCYVPVLQYADHRPLREAMYRAYVTRASELGAPEFDNTGVLRRILELRWEQSRLLGYETYAEVSLVPKMADSPRQVLDFLREFAARAKPYAERDMAELREFAANELGLPQLAAWDLAYAGEKLRARRYAFSEQEVKSYFPEDRVLAGLFKVAETLFAVHIRAAQAPTWHKDVRFYQISDAQGNPVGQFYLDLYARAQKRGGAWMDAAISRRRTTHGTQVPVTYLTCNFSAPVNGKPALFTHGEVNTLFHEFGHGLHHLLTQVDCLSVSGISGVEWDAVELPSQFMENFCWEWDVVKHLSSHVETGAPLPRELFDKMLAAKNFQSGVQTVRQLEFALFDLQLHGDFDPHGPASPLDLLQRVREDVAVVPYPCFNRQPHSFAHIFAGGYAAGYYSYKWAEVLSADAYSLFEEMGVLSAEAGARFKREVLARGGSRPALDSFIAFRGRSPTIDALLRHIGMSA